MRIFAPFVLVLCALVGASSSASHEAAHMAMTQGMLTLRQHATDLSMSVQSALNSAQHSLSTAHMQMEFYQQQSINPFHSMALPSATCVNAVLALNATVSSASCITFTSILSNLNNFTLSIDQLTTLCSSTCLQSLVSAAASVSASCHTTDAAALTTQISQLISFTNLVCTKDPTNPNNFCVPQFNAAVNSLNNLKNPTNAQLQSVCTPCTLAMFNGLAAYGVAPANANSTIAMLCSTDPTTGNFCYVEIMQTATLFSTFSSTNLPQISNADFEPLCSPCGKRFAVLGGAGAIAGQLDGLCVKSGNDFCIVKTVNSLLAIGQSSGCGAFGNFINTVGCCVNSLVAIDPAVVTQFNAAYSLCGVNNPGTCPLPTYTGTFSFIILNLAFSFYQQNSAAVNAAIISDLSINLGVASTQITINSVVAAVNGSQPIGIQVTVTIIFNSALTSSGSQSNFNTNTKTGNFPLSAVAQLGPSSKIAPANPVSASTTGASSSVTGGSTSPAAKQAPFSSLVLVAAAFIALLFSGNNY